MICLRGAVLCWLSVCFAGFALAAVAKAPDVSHIAFDGGSHSAVGVTFAVNQKIVGVRLRYIPVSEGSCTSGDHGQVQGSNQGQFINAFIRADATGLAPDTEYEFCPEVTSDGQHWTTGAGAKWKTMPLPKIHPALPIPPATFDSDYPNTRGFAVIKLPADCAGLQQALNKAISMQMVRGTVIKIPAGAVCVGAYQASASPDIVEFSGAAVSNHAIRIDSQRLTEGQGVIFGNNGYHGRLPGGIDYGALYYVHIVAPNQYELYSGAPFSRGGKLVPMSAGAGAQHFVKWPRPLKPVIVRTATPDSEFTPEHVRTGPAWVRKMAVMRLPLSDIGRGVFNVLFKPELDGAYTTFAANIRFVGIEFTYPNNPESSSDPRPGWTLFATGPTNSRIILDRCYIHGLGFPNRVGNVFFYNGREMAVKDSYWDNLDYWHGSRSGFALKQTGPNSFTIGAGVIHYGRAATLSQAISVSFSGTPAITSPEIAVYYDMAGTLTIAAPEGMAAQTASARVISTKKPGNGACSLRDTVFPKDENGRLAAGPVACVELTRDGQIAKLVEGDPGLSADNYEGCQCFIAGVGPGPFQITNNYISGSGILVHFDDSGGAQARGDYTIDHNTFHLPLEHMYNGKLSDGYRYGNRQPLEWKGGQRIRVNGNIFDGEWSEDTPTAPFIVITPRSGGYTTDVDITNNTFRHGSAGTSPITTIDYGLPFASDPGLRFRLKNNLFWDINGWVYTTDAPALGTLLPATGGPDEDMIIDHNTFFDNRGRNSQWVHWSGYPLEGVQITNNFLFYSDTGGGGGMRSEAWKNSRNCTGLGNEAFMNCAFIAGSKPDYVFAGNAIVPSWRDTRVPSGQVDRSTIEGQFPSLGRPNSILPSRSGVEKTVATVGWMDPNRGDFRLRKDSPYASAGKYHATDGSDVGVNTNALEAAEGMVSGVNVPSDSITADSARVDFLAPDSFGCSVDYSSSDLNIMEKFARVSDAGGNERQRGIQLTGLSPNTVYYYRINCAVEQPQGEFRTRQRGLAGKASGVASR